jgi:long-subunit fatty acid transport protein
MKKIVIATVLAALCLDLAAQNEVDALRFSQTDLPVTGRSLGMGGAFGAVGADQSNLFTNPAGLGGYRRRNFDISFGLHDVVSNASYMGTVNEQARTRFNLNSIGITGHQTIENSAWKAVNFGFAHSKTNNFYQNLTIGGNSNGTTLMDQFASQAAGIHPDDIMDLRPFGAGLAYQTYAIDPVDTLGTSYYANSYTGDIRQNKNIQRTGVQSETAFGLGANYNDMLWLGMSINFSSVRFREFSNLSERFDNDAANYLSSLNYRENLYSDGTGVGIKLGAVVLPTDWLRVGAAFHSATRITITETYTADMNTVERSGLSWSQDSPSLVTEYSLRTPARYMANLAFILSKQAVLAVDYDYAAYNKMKMNGLRNNTYNYVPENEVISTVYKGTHRVRAGVEYRVAEAVRLRAGAIYQQSPFVSGVGAVTTPKMTYTGGIGYFSDYFTIDLGFAYSHNKESYYLYSPALVDAANIKNNRYMGILSVGMRY